MRNRSRQRLVLVTLVTLVGIVVWFVCNYWRSHRYDKIIAAVAPRYQLDPALVKAVIWRESRFNPRARGRAGEVGLMQVREVAALEGGFQYLDCLNPTTNIMAGSAYLKKVMARYARTANPIPYALADYNAGRGNVLKWQTGAATTNAQAFLNQIQFPGTRDYVRSILHRATQYRPDFGS